MFDETYLSDVFQLNTISKGKTEKALDAFRRQSVHPIEATCEASNNLGSCGVTVHTVHIYNALLTLRPSRTLETAHLPLRPSFATGVLSPEQIRMGVNRFQFHNVGICIGSPFNHLPLFLKV